MTTRRWRLTLVLLAVVGGSGAVMIATSERDHALVEYAEPVVRLNQDDIYLVANHGQYEMQRTKGFRPRADVDPVPLSLPVDWSADPFNDRNWQFQLHAWRMIDPILYEYFRTGQADFLEEALAYMLDWWRFHEGAGQTSRFAWYDMATGIRAMRLAFMVDALQARQFIADPVATSELLTMAERHVTRLRDPEFINRGNHGVFQIHGLRLLCAVSELAGACDGEADYSNEMMLKLLDHQFTREGVHKEDSPSYHFFATKLFGELVDPKWYGIGESLRERVQKARAVEPWLIFPNGEVARFGDSDGSRSTDELVAGGDPACAAPEARDECVRLGDFSTSGYAIIRSDWAVPAEQASMLFVSGMAYGSGHEHADELSFELFEFGRRIIVDRGKYGYEKDDVREYVRSVRAHNTVSLPDRPLGPADTRLTGSALAPVAIRGDDFVISGEIERADALRHQRELVYRPGAFLLITDQVETEGEPFAALLHVAHELEVTREDDAFLVQASNGRRARLELLAGECAGEVIEGQDAPRLQGWESVGYLQMTPAPTVRFACAHDTEVVQTLISFDPEARAEAIRLAGQGRHMH